VAEELAGVAPEHGDVDIVPVELTDEDPVGWAASVVESHLVDAGG
jgi:hypothetical protein